MSILNDNTTKIRSLLDGISNLPKDRYEEGYEEGKSVGYDEGIVDGKQVEYDAFWDVFQNYGNRTNYLYGFAGHGWRSNTNPSTFNPKYLIRATGNASGIFYTSQIGRMDLTIADLSQATNLTSAFQNGSFTYIEVDVSSCTNLMTAFGSGTINTVILHNLTEKCTSFSAAFSGAAALETLTISGTIAASINLSACKVLNIASISNIFVNNLSMETSGLTATFSKTAVDNAFESSEGAADGSTQLDWTMFVNLRSNWTISLV